MFSSRFHIFVILILLTAFSVTALKLTSLLEAAPVVVPEDTVEWMDTSAEVISSYSMDGGAYVDGTRIHSTSTASFWIKDTALETTRTASTTWTGNSSTANQTYTIHTGATTSETPGTVSTSTGSTFNATTVASTTLESMSTMVGGADWSAQTVKTMSTGSFYFTQNISNKTVVVMYNYHIIDSYDGRTDGQRVVKVSSTSDSAGEWLSISEVTASGSVTPDDEADFYRGEVVLTTDSSKAGDGDDQVWVEDGDTLTVSYYGVGTSATDTTDNSSVIDSTTASVSVSTPLNAPTPTVTSTPIPTATPFGTPPPTSTPTPLPPVTIIPETQVTPIPVGGSGLSAIVIPGVPTVLRDEALGVTLSLPAYTQQTTYQVAVDTADRNCEGVSPEGGTLLTCVNVSLYDHLGNSMNRTRLWSRASLAVELSALQQSNLGGNAMAYIAGLNGEVRIQTYDPSRSGSEWMDIRNIVRRLGDKVSFTVETEHFSTFGLVLYSEGYESQKSATEVKALDTRIAELESEIATLRSKRKALTSSTDLPKDISSATSIPTATPTPSPTPTPVPIIEVATPPVGGTPVGRFWLVMGLLVGTVIMGLGVITAIGRERKNSN